MANSHVTQDSTEVAYQGNGHSRVTQDSTEVAYQGNGHSHVTQDSTEVAYQGNGHSHVTQDSTELAWQQKVNTHVTQASVELAWKQVVTSRITQDSTEIAYKGNTVTIHVTQDSVELAWTPPVIDPNTITSNTFIIRDLVTQLTPNNNGIVQAILAQIDILGSNTFYELGTLILQAAANNLSFAVAQGTLDAILVNTSSNSTALYVSNTTGIFTNSGNFDIIGVYARSFAVDVIQRMNIGFVANSDPRTGSFDSIDFELITDSITGATGNVIGANSTAIDVVVASGTFGIGDTITGTDSSATAEILGFSNTGFSIGDPVAQKSQVIQIANVQGSSNTGSYQIGEIVYQQRKNILSSDAITQNTMVGIVDFCNSTVVTMSSTFGNITNNSFLIGATSNCLSTINNVKTLNTATGVVYSSNSSTIQITQVSGTFMLAHKIYGPNSYANLVTSLANLFLISSINSAINTLDVIRGTGQLTITTSNSNFVVDSNTAAIANVIAIGMTEE